MGEDQRRMRRMICQSCVHSTRPALTASCGRHSPLRVVIQGRAAGHVPKARIAEAAAAANRLLISLPVPAERWQRKMVCGIIACGTMQAPRVANYAQPRVAVEAGDNCVT